MNTDTKNVIKGILLSLVAVAFVVFLGASVKASGPSALDYSIIEKIKVNQKILAKDRSAYQEFLKVKQDNQDLVLQMNDGYTVDWKTMTPKPSFTLPRN